MENGPTSDDTTKRSEQRAENGLRRKHASSDGEKRPAQSTGTTFMVGTPDQRQIARSSHMRQVFKLLIFEHTFLRKQPVGSSKMHRFRS